MCTHTVIQTLKFVYWVAKNVCVCDYTILLHIHCLHRPTNTLVKIDYYNLMFDCAHCALFVCLCKKTTNPIGGRCFMFCFCLHFILKLLKRCINMPVIYNKSSYYSRFQWWDFYTICMGLDSLQRFEDGIFLLILCLNTCWINGLDLNNIFEKVVFVPYVMTCNKSLLYFLIYHTISK